MKYLKSEFLQNIIKKSWKKSQKHDIVPDLDKPLIKVREDKLSLILKKNQKLITQC